MRVAVLLGALLGGVAAVPRQLQAGGRPDKCSDDASFQAWLALVNAACVNCVPLRGMPVPFVLCVYLTLPVIGLL